MGTLVTLEEARYMSTRELSVLSLQLFCKCKIISNRVFENECNCISQGTCNPDKLLVMLWSKTQ